MKNKVLRFTIMVVSVIFVVRIVTIFTADRLYSMSLAAEKGAIPLDRAIALIDISVRVDSTNADLYFKKYELLDHKIEEIERESENRALITDIRKKQLGLLQKCINLSPSWPEYHIHYALLLKRMSPRPNIITREVILSESEKAYELKPYSQLYRKIYESNLEEFSSIP